MAVTRKSASTTAQSSRPRAGASRKPQAAANVPAVRASQGTPVMRLARQLRSWTGSLLNITVAATDITITIARQGFTSPEQKEILRKTGSLLRGARKTAGLSIEELGKAVNLKDPVLLELAENGKTALPFEIILRLTAVLGRKDPVVFLLNLARSHNPGLWKTLEDLGLGRLLVQAGREREFANIYRACDQARALSDAEFARLLAFMQASFDMAINFHAKSADARLTA
ncbi:helix-turn-helix transcriptional regulator [Noviherbaspirillum sp.]|uniref:helix-turn-helix domain-containing protein n=1 Tax=Noviherbaspirillum sp. TaxID=1926288 RepID=UPI002B49025F|nr:helix-turn-helix transcriptional regulator [Noviherbaspirillum sp.]HJV83800.1 helix-turn-helix transcriptional regulator [Noviherbaspirillum sp.]